MGVMIPVDMISTLCQMLLQRAAGLQRCFCLGRVPEGLVLLAREFSPLRLIFSATNNASMTHTIAAERHRICQTQHGWEGKTRLLYSFHLSFLFLSHEVKSCKKAPVPADCCRPGFSFQEKGGSD